MKPIIDIRTINGKGFREPVQMTPYKLPLFCFAFIMEGEALVEIEGKNILITPGQLLLVPENHTIIIKHFKDCQGYDGCFSINALKDASYPILRSDSPILQSFWFDDAVFIGALMKRMKIAVEDKDKTFLQSAIDLILGQLHANGKVAAVPEKFLQLVFDMEKAPLSVSEYAEILQVTANYLNKTVKSHTHRTAMDWIEIARLNLAKNYLKDRNMPIAEIAEKTGLVDQSYFSRFFKKKTGLTPSQYRNSL